GRRRRRRWRPPASGRRSGPARAGRQRRPRWRTVVQVDRGSAQTWLPPSAGAGAADIGVTPQRVVGISPNRAGIWSLERPDPNPLRVDEATLVDGGDDLVDGGLLDGDVDDLG